ncbi:TetR/AcrR family transcriptional regulator [Micromonospora sp. NPDC050187]|uniref:TetR/AcrR family transcriptional regulator n=1 Tax=Micromonospora sp. NPDC050187 TaxID=3364277 RepID=UPI0037AB2E8F
MTTQLIAAHGYTGCSLQRIAEAAGITKAAVIYHIATKQAVIRAAYDTVVSGLTEHVGALIAEAETPAGRVETCVDSSDTWTITPTTSG